jgi:3-deoxy-7-phosphoheptulonate synthase
VAQEVGQQISAGEERIFGVMAESHLVAGRQDHTPGQPLTYGQSVTDACLGWDDSVRLLDVLAEAVARREQLAVE